MANEFDDRSDQVRHPLSTVRRYIRRYVLLETAAILVLGVACWFWLGLFFDFGLFKAAAFDWMLELDFLDPSGKGSFWVRAIIALAVLAVLGYLIVSRLVIRLLSEFSDSAVAMVLERRFPRELGDRLITAVELSDPKKAEAYGFSGDMLRQTIREAAERVECVPVADVFDWGRLRRLWLAAVGATVGLLAVALGGWLGIQAAGGDTVSPFHALYGFRDLAGVWMERNALLKSTYWPRYSHLEVVRFQDTDAHPDEMRVGRNEARPDLIVRAVEWVVPDKNGVTGWRGLQITDLHNFLGLEERSLPIPEHWGGWIVDVDDLPKQVPTGLVPQHLQGKTVAELDDEVKDQDAMKKSGHQGEIENLGDWQTWTFDKLLLQASKDEVKERLKKDCPGALEKIAQLEKRLEDIAADPAMGRRLRHLKTPQDVQITFRGATTQSRAPVDTASDRKFTFGLADLKESASFFVRGGDFFTRPLRIKLVPPPSVIELNLDKEEPAYLYWRIPGDQMPLKGKRQIFRGQKAAVGGERTSIDVPIGSDLIVRARADRELQPGVKILASSQAREAGVVVPDQTPVDRDADGKGFSVSFKKVTRPMEFQFEFFDLDNVRGFRRMQIRPIDDLPPDIANFELMTVLRKGKFKEGLQRTLAGGAADGFLITPKASLPVNGTVHDDVDLTKLVWAFETQPITIEKGSDKEPARVVLQGNPTIRRTGLIASLFQFGPMGQGQLLAAPSYLGLVARVIEADLKMKQADPERYAPLAGFELELQRLELTPLDKIDELLTALPKERKERTHLREHLLKNRESFNVREMLPDLRVTEPGSPKEVFHVLKLSLVATDNNVETGPATSRTRAPIQFLIVPEAELLAQIGIEEEVLFDRFKKVVIRLETAQTTLRAQVQTLKTGAPDTDYSLSVYRLDEVRKGLLDTASATREIFSDYSRILEELKVNNVRADKISDLTNKIVSPLDQVLGQQFGLFPMTDDAVQQLYTKLDEDVNAKRVGKNIAEHAKASVDAAEKMDALVERMKTILAAIDRGVDFAQVQAIIAELERSQRDAIEPLVRYEGAEIEKLLKGLTGDPPPKK
jgi:hypothetical protein